MTAVSAMTYTYRIQYDDPATFARLLPKQIIFYTMDQDKSLSFCLFVALVHHDRAYRNVSGDTNFQNIKVHS